MQLDNSVTVVTGASRGIGLSLARQLTAAGGRVVLVDIDAPSLVQAAETLPSELIATVEADVRDVSSLTAAIQTATEKFGGCNVWINNAGLARHKPIVDYTIEDLDLMMDVNLKGTALGSQVALRHFIDNQTSGHIINVISTASLRGIPTESFYCATKWGVRGFTQALAEEAAELGVRVTGILPGGVHTKFWDDAIDREMPVSDFLTPDQVAQAMISVIQQDENVVTRELVLRSIHDRDFAQ